MSKRTRTRLLLIPIAGLLCLIIVYHANPNRTASWRSSHEEEIVGKIADHIANENPRLTGGHLASIARAVYEESENCGLDYRFVLAVMKVESNFSQKAVSSKGARGLLQIKPSLAKYIAPEVGIEWHGARTLDDPGKNVKIGLHLLSGLMEDFDNLHMALHAYNMGSRRLKEVKGVMGKRYKPEKGFSKIVLDEYDKNVSLLPDP
jgi:soluble lytic murein transglycosylase